MANTNGIIGAIALAAAAAAGFVAGGAATPAAPVVVDLDGGATPANLVARFKAVQTLNYQPTPVDTKAAADAAAAMATEMDAAKSTLQKVDAFDKNAAAFEQAHKGK